MPIRVLGGKRLQTRILLFDRLCGCYDEYCMLQKIERRVLQIAVALRGHAYLMLPRDSTSARSPNNLDHSKTKARCAWRSAELCRISGSPTQIQPLRQPLFAGLVIMHKVFDTKDGIGRR